MAKTLCRKCGSAVKVDVRSGGRKGCLCSPTSSSNNVVGMSKLRAIKGNIPDWDYSANFKLRQME